MKIATIVCVWPPYKSGMGGSACQLSKMMTEKGHEVTVFTPDYNYVGRETKQPEQTSAGKIIKLRPCFQYGNSAFLPQLLFKLSNFNIIYLHYPFFGAAEVIWLAKVLFGKKFKLIIHYHMDVIGLSPILKIPIWPSKLIRASLFKKAETIVCASLDYIKSSDIKKTYEEYPAKFKEIPFSVESDKFTPAPKGNDGIKKILFVGGLDKAHYFKGVNILLEAVSKLQIPDSQGYQLLIVGDGDLKPKYEEQTKKLHIADKIRFLGRIEDNKLPLIYQQADLFVLPSTKKNEAFGLVLLEAMASGLPVIASDLPGVRTVFQNGRQGLLAKPEDVNDLKNKIEKIFSNEKKREQMGQEARKLILEKYNWEKISQQLDDIIK